MDCVRLAQRILPDAFTLHIFEVYPGTVLGDIARTENLIDPERENAEFVGQTDTTLRLPGFPREEILRCFRLFPFRVYWKSAPFKALLFYFYTRRTPTSSSGCSPLSSASSANSPWASSRLLKKAHLRCYAHPSSLRRTPVRLIPRGFASLASGPF